MVADFDLGVLKLLPGAKFPKAKREKRNYLFTRRKNFNHVCSFFIIFMRSVAKTFTFVEKFGLSVACKVLRLSIT